MRNSWQEASITRILFETSAGDRSALFLEVVRLFTVFMFFVACYTIRLP